MIVLQERNVPVVLKELTIELQKKRVIFHKAFIISSNLVLLHSVSLILLIYYEFTLFYSFGGINIFSQNEEMPSGRVEIKEVYASYRPFFCC